MAFEPGEDKQPQWWKLKEIQTDKHMKLVINGHW